MSQDPGMAASGPAPGPGQPAGHEPAAGPEVTRVEVLPLREGDRLIVHVDGTVGMSAAGAHRAGLSVRDALRLDDLPFDVPVIVVPPGIRVEVTRPS